MSNQFELESRMLSFWTRISSYQFQPSHIRSSSICLLLLPSLQPSHVLTAQSNEILTAVIQGARKEEPVPAVRLAALQALYNSLEFVSANFENPGERNYIMQIVCEATQTAVAPEASREEREALEGIKINSFECLVRIMNLYYDKMRPYVEQALFGVSIVIKLRLGHRLFVSTRYANLSDRLPSFIFFS